ncbi:MAG: hypothetical protein MUQ30_19855, partial [Anaerolineae bacterium]|nr:hypothetical protein [Anaerolineae bacterium]
MNTTLAQALQLTVLGMGMTFASIGVLALVMLLMTWMTREKDRAGTPVGVRAGDEKGMTEMAGGSEADELSDGAAARAVAAAVAVALTNAAPATTGPAQAAAAAVAVALAGRGSDMPQVEVSAVDAWDGY